MKYQVLLTLFLLYDKQVKEALQQNLHHAVVAIQVRSHFYLLSTLSL